MPPPSKQDTKTFTENTKYSHHLRFSGFGNVHESLERDVTSPSLKPVGARYPKLPNEEHASTPRIDVSPN